MVWITQPQTSVPENSKFNVWRKEVKLELIMTEEIIDEVKV
jgi:hypothetical protein